MKLSILKLFSLLFIFTVASADIVNNDVDENEKLPALIEFKMVRTGFFKDLRSPRMVLSIDPEPYEYLGSPKYASFKLEAWGYKSHGGLVYAYTDIHESVNAPLVKDNKINKYVAKLNYAFKGGPFDYFSGVSFLLESVCLSQKNTNCVNVDILAASSNEGFTKKTLWFDPE